MLIDYFDGFVQSHKDKGALGVRLDGRKGYKAAAVEIKRGSMIGKMVIRSVSGKPLLVCECALIRDLIIMLVDNMKQEKYGDVQQWNY